MLKPEVLTTFSWLDCIYHTWRINRHLTSARISQITSVKIGQGHWFFQAGAIRSIINQQHEHYHIHKKEKKRAGKQNTRKDLLRKSAFRSYLATLLI
jgi:hypothetical protein